MVYGVAVLDKIEAPNLRAHRHKDLTVQGFGVLLPQTADPGLNVTCWCLRSDIHLLATRSL